MSTWRLKTFLDHKVARVPKELHSTKVHMSQSFLDLATVYKELQGTNVIHLQTDGHGDVVP